MKKVLIVEDSLSTSRALRTVLNLHEFDVVGEARDGEQAVDLFQKLKPDLTLMDIAMPKKHGIDAIRDILKIDNNARIIAVTALYSPEKKREIMDAGAKALVVKPFDVPDLIKTIEDTLAS